MQMGDIRDGSVSILEQLTIDPWFSFEQFRHTKFYKDQDGIKVICLDGPQERYGWGKISSDYDDRSNLSSINILYFH